MIKYIKIIKWFIFDLFKSRKNDLHINKNSSYQLMRGLYRISNGLITNVLAFFLCGLNYKNSNKFKKGFLELEKIHDHKINELKKEIAKMKVFDQREINNFNYSDNTKQISDYAFKFEELSSKDIIRMDVVKSELLSNKVVTNFVTDKKWIKIVKKIINVEPKLVDVTSWYTLPHKKELDLNKYSAQIWHRDVDKIRDLKIFIYLSDVVSLDKGPFEILINSHRMSLDKLRYENKNNFRISDDKIKNKNIYLKHSFLGEKGTNFIVDTRCLHRGGVVKNEFRQVIELYFSNSSFGKHEYFNLFSKPNLKSNWESYDIWKRNIENYPGIYNTLFMGKKNTY